MDAISAVLGLLSEPWVLLVLTASVMFAAGNFIDELLLTKYNQSIGTLVIISGLFGLVLMAGFGLFATITPAQLSLPIPVVFQAIGVGVLELLWVIPYLYATERRGAVIAGPLFQSVPVVALGIEAFYGVIPPQVQIAGALCIVLGGIILSIEKEGGEDGETTHHIDWVTLGLMSLSATLIALIYVLFKDAAGGEARYVAVGFWSGLGMLLTGTMIWLVVPSYRIEFNTFTRQANGKAVGIQFFNEILDAGGAYLTHLANVIGPSVMLVTAFNASQPIAIALIGALLCLFGIKHASSESKAPWVLIIAAVAFIATGTVIIALH
ncbi:MAG TPA: hypothetical protein VGE31_02975 [Candidatus Paceibacterota bacterium]